MRTSHFMTKPFTTQRREAKIRAALKKPD